MSGGERPHVAHALLRDEERHHAGHEDESEDAEEEQHSVARP